MRELVCNKTVLNSGQTLSHERNAKGVLSGFRGGGMGWVTYVYIGERKLHVAKPVARKNGFMYIVRRSC